ncbi:Hsp20/alpha crystallin family protein [Stenotrophomonas maltophilia]|nr:Hsp20/alpha crystallin family protein [Stenotrophomonas maltophilia]
MTALIAAKGFGITVGSIFPNGRHRWWKQRTRPHNPNRYWRTLMALPTRWNAFGQNSRFDLLPDLEDLARSIGLRGPLARQYEHMLEMRMDVTEDSQGYHVRLDVPGVKKEDIDISIDGNQVTVTAEAKRERTHEQEKELYSERYEGQVYRSFNLPADIDGAKAQAHYDGGVLRLDLPRKSGSGSRKLPVN